MWNTFYRKIVLFLLSLSLGSLSCGSAFPAKKNIQEKPKECSLETISSKPEELSIKLDNKPQKLQMFTRYRFQEKISGKNKSVVASEISGIVFSDFSSAYNNFLKKRVGPKDRCDKLEIGKIQVSVDKNGSANGYFVGRYDDRTCLHLKFFDSAPGETDRNLFVISSAKGITGVKNSFIPTIEKGSFILKVQSTYEPIEEPSIFGRGEATLSGLYKEPLEGFLSEKSFVSLTNSLIPNLGKKKSSFVLKTIGFTKNKDKKIQLTFLSQKKTNITEACEFRGKLLKNKDWAEEKE